MRETTVSSYFGRRGQFVPMALLVIFASLVFMVGVIDIYRVAKAKLKVQNLADAIALNVAATEAQSMNAIPDRNEWLNHLYPDSNQNDPFSPQLPACRDNDDKRLPRLDCVTTYKKFSKLGAVTYAGLVKNMNDAQTLFAAAYNKMLGAYGGSGKSGLAAQLELDIPDLASGDYAYSVSNQGNSSSMVYVGGPRDSISMRPIEYEIVDMNITWQESGFMGVPVTKRGTLASVLGLKGQKVGYMKLKNPPTISLPGKAPLIGAHSQVLTTVPLYLAPARVVSAKSFAYVVPGSGMIADNKGGGRPRFRPTFYVQLGN